MTEPVIPIISPEPAIAGVTPALRNPLEETNNLAFLTKPTRLLDFGHPAIQRLITERHWRDLTPFDRVGAAYTFVRDEIAFGYNESDSLPASRVLTDGLGQCNTKGTLLMALLRALGFPCRLHGFTIHKALQHGAITGLAYRLAPRHILHSWVEVWFDERWIHLEGFILDRTYLNALQTRFAGRSGPFRGFGVATPNLGSPPVDWNGQHTYIQRDGIDQDFGVFNSPDEFYARHGTNLTGMKQWVFLHLVRDRINRRVAAIRAGLLPPR